MWVLWGILALVLLWFVIIFGLLLVSVAGAALWKFRNQRSAITALRALDLLGAKRSLLVEEPQTLEDEQDTKPISTAGETPMKTCGHLPDADCDCDFEYYQYKPYVAGSCPPSAEWMADHTLRIPGETDDEIIDTLLGGE